LLFLFILVLRHVITDESICELVRTEINKTI